MFHNALKLNITFFAFFMAAILLGAILFFNQIFVQQASAAVLDDVCASESECSDTTDDGPLSCRPDPRPTAPAGQKVCCSTTWGCKGGGSESEIKQLTGLGEKDPREVAANVINVVLGFLGIIAVLLILTGGFRWMTAQGNDEQISGAKNLMIAGVVGLVIILAAFGIARFVVDALVGATTNN